MNDYSIETATERIVDSRTRAYFDENHLVEMAIFFLSNPEAYPLMADVLKKPVTAYAERNINNFALCWFTSDTLDNHIQKIFQRITIPPTKHKTTMPTTQ